MKKSVGLVLCLVLLITSVFVIPANAVVYPTTKSEYTDWFTGQVTMLEQKYGTNNLGDTAAHSAVLTLGNYQYQFTSPGDTIFVDANDFTVNIYTNDLIMTFTGEYKPKSLCLGVIATDMSGVYQPGKVLSVSVNGGAAFEYTTQPNFDDNALVIVNNAGINTITLLGHPSGDAYWHGLSYFYISDSNLLPGETPSTPVLEAKTSDSVTLVTIPAAEYSKDGTTWQDSNVFTGLSPGTEYTFYARLKATQTELASPKSDGLTVTTEKGTQQAPAAPTLESKTAESVTLAVIEGAQYSLDGTTWQDSNVFTELSPAVEYTFYARLKETQTQFASPSSGGLTVTTDKATQQAPGVPVLEAKTADSVTLVLIEGAQYSKDGTIWQDSNVFTELSPAVEYTFYARLKETQTQFASPSSGGLTVTTDKGTQEAPGAPTLETTTPDSVTLVLIEGAQYSLDGTTWQDSNVFTGLSPDTEYTFYIRYKETVTQYASDTAQITLKTSAAPIEDDQNTADTGTLAAGLIVLFALAAVLWLKRRQKVKAAQ